MELPDLGIPGLPGLLAADGRAALRGFLTEQGWTGLRAAPVQFLCRPDHSASATYQVEAEHRSGDVDVLTVTVACRRQPDPPAAAAGTGPYTVWVYPHDPFLPGLPAAAHGDCVPDADRARVPAPEVERVTYRPRHRAVMRYRRLAPDGETLLFAKVLRPARARAAWAASRALKASGLHVGVRLALPFARRDQGVLLSRPMPGERLRSLLVQGESLPDPSRIAHLGDQLATLADVLPPPAPGATGRGAHPAWARSAARLLAAVVPTRAEKTFELGERIAGDAAQQPPPRSEVVHGDLHEAQILVAPDGTLALVDLDDLGHGDAVLEAATLSAHLLLLADGAADGAVRARVLAYREEVRTAGLKRLDCGEEALRWREAYRLLLLASGPLRVLRPDWPDRVGARLDLAEQVAAGRA